MVDIADFAILIVDSVNPHVVDMYKHYFFACTWTCMRETGHVMLMADVRYKTDMHC